MIYLQLFIEFFKIGLFAVGGGLATIPFLMELPEKYDWYTLSDMASMIAISESTPGPVGVNMATYAGYNATGILGGIVATLSLVLPSLIVITIISKLLANFNQNPYVKAAFWSIRPAVAGLIGSAVIGIIQTSIFTSPAGEWIFPVIPVIICAVFFGIMNVKKFKKLHPVVWLIAGACIGIILKL
jgi:chromate transporter